MPMLQLSPPLPIITPKGPGIAHFLIDPGLESHLQWVVIQTTGEARGECWTWENPKVRFEDNVTIGREKAQADLPGLVDRPTAEGTSQGPQPQAQDKAHYVKMTKELAEELLFISQSMGANLPMKYPYLQSFTFQLAAILKLKP